MIITMLGMAVFLLLGIVLPVHALGGWLMVIVLHGFLVSKLGQGAVHLPLAVGVGVIAALLINRKWSGVRGSAFALVTAISMLMVVSAVLGINFDQSYSAIVQYGKSFLLALLLAGCLKTFEDFEVITRYLVVSVGFGAAIAVYQHYSGQYTINTEYVQRAAGLRNDPNDTAMILVAGVPVGFYWLLESRNLLLKIMWGGILFLILLGVVLTGSRGGFVALAAVMTALFIKRPSLNVLLACVVFSVLFAAVAPASYWERMSTLMTGKELQGGRSLNNRLELQKRGVLIFAERPVSGVGPGNFGEAFAGFGRQGLVGVPTGSTNSEERVFAVAHNLHLEFFAENGFLTGILIWILFSIALRELVRLDKWSLVGPRGIGIGFTTAVALGSMLLAGLFLSQGKNSVLWFLVGLGLAAQKLNAEGTATVPELAVATRKRWFEQEDSAKEAGVLTLAYRSSRKEENG